MIDRRSGGSLIDGGQRKRGGEKGTRSVGKSRNNLAQPWYVGGRPSRAANDGPQIILRSEGVEFRGGTSDGSEGGTVKTS